MPSGAILHVAVGQTMDFPEALRAFDAGLELAGHAVRTRHHYAYELTGFWVWCALREPIIDIIAATSADVGRYVTSFDPHGSKRGDALRALKSFYRFLLNEHYRSADPTVLMQTPRPRPNRQAPDIPDGHLARMLRAAFDHDDPRRGWNLLLLYATGSRIGAYCAVRPSDVDLDRGRIYFSTTKNDRPYELGLARKQLIAARHVVGFGHDPIAGVGSAQLRNWLHDAESTAGLPRMWPHLLRHAFSHRVAANCGGDPEKWRIAMNHADLSQWSTYNSRTLESVREVLEAV